MHRKRSNVDVFTTGFILFYELIYEGDESVFTKLLRLLSTTVIIFLAASPVFAAGGGLWLTAGNVLRNTRFQNTETTIGVANAASLIVEWQFTTGGDLNGNSGQFRRQPQRRGNKRY